MKKRFVDLIFEQSFQLPTVQELKYVVCACTRVCTCVCACMHVRVCVIMRGVSLQAKRFS